MKALTVYRILSFILIPLAALFGLFDILFLIMSLASPALLLAVFIYTSFVIYTFTSYRFMVRGIDTGRPLKHSLRDWIRVNAFVSLFIGITFLTKALDIFFSSDLSLRNNMAELMETQPNFPLKMDPDTMVKSMRTIVYFILFVSVVLLVHIQLTFRFLKQYRNLFAGDY